MTWEFNLSVATVNALSGCDTSYNNQYGLYLSNGSVAAVTGSFVKYKGADGVRATVLEVYCLLNRASQYIITEMVLWEPVVSK